jgi:hypothetical protein
MYTGFLPAKPLVVVKDIQLFVDGLAYYAAGVLAQLGAAPAALGAGKKIGTAVLYFYHPQDRAIGGLFVHKGRVGFSIECKLDVEAH